MDKLFPLVGGSTLVVLLCLALGFSNSFRNSSLIVSTIVSTRVLSPTSAFIVCAFSELLGAFLFGTAIVATIAHQMFHESLSVSHTEILCVLAAGVIAAIGWGILSWRKGLPISNSHALMAGLTGAAWGAWGREYFQMSLMGSIFFFLVFSPLLGFFISWLMTALIRFLGEWLTPRVTPIAEQMHVLTCMLVASADGSNNAQMILAVCLLAQGVISPMISHGTENVIVPLDLRLWVSGVISLGVLFGGRRILKKMGMGFYRIQVTEGLGALATAAGTILSCNSYGFPVSTTQVITGSIVGAGVAKNARAVKWMIAKEIILSWILTVPVVFFIAMATYKVAFWCVSAL